MVQTINVQFSNLPNTLDSVFGDAKKPLFSGCKIFTKLLALGELYNLKVRFEWNNSSFSKLLATISEFLPENNEVWVSIDEVKKKHYLP